MPLSYVKTNSSIGTAKKLILKHIDFLGYQSAHLFYGIDILPDSTISKIEALK